MAAAEEEEVYNTEFRSYVDDAWYSVGVMVEGERGGGKVMVEGERGGGEVALRVKYQNFPDDQDSLFGAGDFKSLRELEEFAGRFRNVSAQLQDRQCSGVVKCMRVCASDTFGLDVRFYDALVDDVVRIEHSFSYGEEECECLFLLCWLHGPNAGNITYKRVANICLLQRFELEPTLESFLKIALQKLVKSDFGTNSDVAGDKVNGGAILKQEPSVSGGLSEEEYARWFFSRVWPSEGGGKYHCEDRQDADLGGDKRNYIILVQNLEKGLSSSTVSEFILKQTSVAAQVSVFPSLPWEPYANGVIVVDCHKDLEQVFGFVQNPEHIVVSSKGRPWVATEKSSMNDPGSVTRESPEKSVKGITGGLITELKVVCAGTEEYKRAKKLRELFLQFIEHQKGQYKRLSREEESIS